MTVKDFTYGFALAHCRHRDGLKWLWVGVVGLCQIRMCGKHNGSLDVGQCHNVFGDLLHLRPVDNTRYNCIHCRCSNWLEKLLLTSWKAERTERQASNKTETPKAWDEVFYVNLPGTIANLVPGGYCEPRGAINPVLLDKCGEVTIKPWQTHTHHTKQVFALITFLELF